jgi:hypothetical protein
VPSVPRRIEAWRQGLIAVTYAKRASNVTDVFDFSGRPMGTLRSLASARRPSRPAGTRTEAFL